MNFSRVIVLFSWSWDKALISVFVENHNSHLRRRPSCENEREIVFWYITSLLYGTVSTCTTLQQLVFLYMSVCWEYESEHQSKTSERGVRCRRQIYVDHTKWKCWCGDRWPPKIPSTHQHRKHKQHKELHYASSLSSYSTATKRKKIQHRRVFHDRAFYYEFFLFVLFC